MARMSGIRMRGDICRRNARPEIDSHCRSNIDKHCSFRSERRESRQIPNGAVVLLPEWVPRQCLVMTSSVRSAQRHALAFRGEWKRTAVPYRENELREALALLHRLGQRRGLRAQLLSPNGNLSQRCRMHARVNRTLFVFAVYPIVSSSRRSIRSSRRTAAAKPEVEAAVLAERPD
jgi:hypothetical protein